MAVYVAEGATGGPHAGGSGAGEHLPVVEQVRVSLDAGEEREVSRIVERIRRRQPALVADAAFGPSVDAGIGPGPDLFIHDMAGIQLLGHPLPCGLEYRLLPLARDGDFLVVSAERNPAFEGYCREHLGLGSVEVLRVRPAGGRPSLATFCRRDAAAIARLAAAAREGGGMNVHPYVGYPAVWRLASSIAERARVHVRVSAPPPRLAVCANDKLWFARRVAELLGPDSQPPGRAARDFSSLAAHLADLADTCDQIVIKLPRSAGSRGNTILDCARLRTLSVDAVRAELVDRFRRLGWRRPFPLQVAVWETPVVMSPSVQLWIPGAGRGPIVEGIFEQHLAGDVGLFTGAVPAALPAGMERRIAREAVILATAFQRLGYFGRCSFDAILVGESAARARLHWVECNGRWGGTSLPMTMVNRLIGDWARASFATMHPDWPLRLPFDAVLERTIDRLFHTGSDTGVVFVSPGDVDAGSGIEFAAIAPNARSARRQIDRVSERLGQPGHGEAARRRAA